MQTKILYPIYQKKDTVSYEIEHGWILRFMKWDFTFFPFLTEITLATQFGWSCNLSLEKKEKEWVQENWRKLLKRENNSRKIALERKTMTSPYSRSIFHFRISPIRSPLWLLEKSKYQFPVFRNYPSQITRNDLESENKGAILKSMPSKFEYKCNCYMS